MCSPSIMFHLLVASLCTLYAQQVYAVPSTESLASGLRILYQNDLDWNRAASTSRQSGYILLTAPQNAAQAAQACKALGEQLVSSTATTNSGLEAQLSNLVYEGTYSVGQKFWARNSRVLTISSSSSTGNVNSASTSQTSTKYPAICTQSAPWNVVNQTDTSVQWQVASAANNVDFLGYRDALSFRFLAVPFANPVQRFSYSTVYNPSVAGTSSIDALTTGRDLQCPQYGSDSGYTEQCLVLNIFTPYLPSTTDIASGKSLRPIFVFIHGGGYTTGSGLDFTFDGGNMASRSDVVVLTVNYRLGSLGALTYNDQIRGNYGLGDLVTALQWVQKYGKAFGGDPSKVTIGGQSAGAQHVENLLASPAAVGLFQRAIVFSGKGHDSAFLYPTIAQAQAGAGGQIVQKLGCNTAPDVLACLRKVSVADMLAYPYTAPSQDGTFLSSPRLDMRNPSRASGHVNRVPIIWGTMRDELASLGIVPSASEQNLQNALNTAGIPANYSQIVLNNPNVFSQQDYGVQNLTVAVNTDIKYRCGIQAMAYASAVNGVFPTVYGYFYDQRAFQIPNYDPQSACQPKSGNLSPSSYYMCHSGDLMTIFHTAGNGFRLAYRDSNDLAWMASIIDQFSAFIRTGSPAPSAAYLQARGKAYASTLARTTSSTGTRWTSLTSSRQKALSFGPLQQRMIALGQKNDQCAALGKGIDYIANM